MGADADRVVPLRRGLHPEGDAVAVLFDDLDRIVDEASLVVVPDHLIGLIGQAQLHRAAGQSGAVHHVLVV